MIRIDQGSAIEIATIVQEERINLIKIKSIREIDIVVQEEMRENLSQNIKRILRARRAQAEIGKKVILIILLGLIQKMEKMERRGRIKIKNLVGK